MSGRSSEYDLTETSGSGTKLKCSHFRWSLWPVHFRLRGDKSNRLRVEDVEWLKPTAHIFYSTRIVEIADTLPKYEGYEGESERIQ